MKLATFFLLKMINILSFIACSGKGSQDCLFYQPGNCISAIHIITYSIFDIRL